MGPTGPAVPYPKEIQVFFLFLFSRGSLQGEIRKPRRFAQARPAVAK